MKVTDLKEFIYKCLKEWPNKMDETIVLETYQELRKSMQEKEAMDLIKTILSKKYKKSQKEVPSLSKNLSNIVPEDENIVKSIEALYEMSNDMLDFTECDDNINENERIIQENIKKSIANKK